MGIGVLKGRDRTLPVVAPPETVEPLGVAQQCRRRLPLQGVKALHAFRRRQAGVNPLAMSIAHCQLFGDVIHDDYILTCRHGGDRKISRVPFYVPIQMDAVALRKGRE